MMRAGGDTTALQFLSDRTSEFLGIKLSAIRKPVLLRAIEDSVRDSRPLSISFLNPNYVMAARSDDELMAQMNRFDVMLADGWGVVWGARFLGVRVPERLANDDIGPDLFDLCDRKAYRVFLLGSAPGVADEAAVTLLRSFPGIQIVGTQHGWLDVERGHPGWFDEKDDRAMLDMVNGAAPDLLIVGLPSPMQQRWVTEHRDELDVPVVMTAGSYLDHVAERVRWYPPIVDTLRLGWLYRLSRDPRRLWKRYSIELLAYARVLVMARLQQVRSKWPGHGEAGREWTAIDPTVHDE